MLEGSVYMLLREGNNALKKAQKNMAALSEENKQMQAMASQWVFTLLVSEGGYI